VRTTVTLDDDLAAQLKDRAHARGVPFKTEINEAIRSGLEQPRDPTPYRLKTKKLGAPKVDLTKATQIAGQLEDDELVRRMNAGR
jgi:plasmid stability protein